MSTLVFMRISVSSGKLHQGVKCIEESSFKHESQFKMLLCPMFGFQMGDPQKDSQISRRLCRTFSHLDLGRRVCTLSMCQEEEWGC